MQMMDDEQPHTIKNTLNKYTIKGMELRKDLVSALFTATAATNACIALPQVGII
jgi:hypothetical protein